MSTKVEQVEFQLLKKTYQVACPAGQRQSLDKVINLLKAHMRKVQKVDAKASMDRIAVVAALNLGHEHQKLIETAPDQLQKRLNALSTRVQQVLDQGKKANLS